ncbi:alkaline phosphatase D family protein [Candidatus Rariloculus sp.]|uniref:alkaline phosphatase D family protein n=1 Tax=Candidatus Rariloculus sp. TaxID=3101265 RepID=UPI003D127F1E
MQQTRREFLGLFSRTAGCFVATASVNTLVGCSVPRPGASAYGFAQGVASADPQADAIMLWTRAVPEVPDDEESVPLRLQLGRDENLSEILIEETCTAERELDYTVRCFVDGLEPSRTYFYRFIAPDSGASRTGRTHTAPAPDADATLTAALCSCQHYEQGLFSAYRRLLLDDAAAASDRKIDLVIHVGDFIYEGNNRAQTDADGQPIELLNADGSPRRFLALGEARSLDDYRELYRTYLTDPDLQDARAAFPFVYTWDDHELFNDYWQSFHPSGPMQRRKVDANQAWFEYMPAALSVAPAGPAGNNPARDFIPAEVEDVAPAEFDDDYLSHERNNLAAIGTLAIHRTLRWGSMAELIVVDGRSYRGPRGMDDAILGSDTVAYTNVPVPAQLVEIQNAGRTANGGNPPDTVVLNGLAVANTRRDAPRGSLLGSAQKAWLKESLTRSDARWKAICNDVPLMRFGFDMSFREHGQLNDLWWTDSWDGYPVERRELTRFVRDNRFANVVSLTGDRHAHFAGLVYDDYDGDAPVAAVPEFACTSISAGPRLKNQVTSSRSDPEIDRLVRFDGRDFGLEGAMLPALNAWLLFGADAARTLSETGDADAARREAKPAVNPHLSYADTDALGYAVVRFTPERVDVEFVTIAQPDRDFGEAGPPVRRRVRFSVPAWLPGEAPALVAGDSEGEPPLMGLRI